MLTALLLPLSARANPVAMEVLRARQVPNTHHVQLTYGVDGQSAATPGATSRDGASLGLSWQGMSGSYKANTGSGLVGVTATQACDCDVPVGQHEYVVRVKSAMGGNEIDLTTSVQVEQDLQTPMDAGVPGGDMMPWEIPEPGAIQGLDCRKACSGAAASDGPLPPKDGGSPGSDTGTGPKIKDKSDDGGCALGGPAGPLAPSLLLLLGLALLRRRS
jgi:hypothetical protein